MIKNPQEIVTCVDKDLVKQFEAIQEEVQR